MDVVTNTLLENIQAMQLDGSAFCHCLLKTIVFSVRRTLQDVFVMKCHKEGKPLLIRETPVFLEVSPLDCNSLFTQIAALNSNQGLLTPC